MKTTVLTSGRDDSEIVLIVRTPDDFDLSAKVREFAVYEGLAWNPEGYFEKVADDSALVRYSVDVRFCAWLKTQPGVEEVPYTEHWMGYRGEIHP